MTQMNLLVKQKETHRHRKLMVTKGECRVGGINHELGIERYKPLYTKETTKSHCLVHGTIFNIL